MNKKIDMVIHNPESCPFYYLEDDISEACSHPKINCDTIHKATHCFGALCPLPTAGSSEQPANGSVASQPGQHQQLKAEIRAIAGRCTIPEKSFRHYYISIADYERLLELSAV